MKIVYINDITDSKLTEMIEYCEENNFKLIYEVIDISDFSGKYDTTTSFQFSSDEHATLFKLKYGI